ncbi:hypothetical protein FOMPIDRAFT_93729 [Fomitopsis schrenkii]|uniref:Cytochrome P450 n=1 Tax=Fomitopsis schrenkii TaxID=2126942 RepID=S8DLC4_FOMSC|nr:hypothetical protein FOMPIDRAFT_93729 [Fomitopsis schrenkii]
MSLLFSAYVSVVLGALYAIYAFFFDRPSRIHAIPTVGGPSLPLLSYIGAVRSLTKAMDIIQEGYTKYKGRCFKYAEFGHWCVVVTSPAAVEELARAPEDVLSFKAAAIDLTQLRYTLGSNVTQNLYHMGTVRTHLMRNAGRMFDDIRDKVVSVFTDEVQSAKGEHEWVSVGAADLAREANDLLQWLVETAPHGHERTVRALVLRVLTVNFAGVHTTSAIFTDALYYLAAYPEHAAALREEVERIVRADGWSKASLGSMRLVNGFLKEVFRVAALNTLSLNRIALQDYTFADGTFIPKGTSVAVASRNLLLEADCYVNPTVFDPRRYEGEGGSPKDNSARTDDHYLVFGHGQHACSGRFFAVTVLKAMLAHIVITYDVKFPGGSRSIPPPMWIGGSRVPNGKANVLFRKRDVCE